MLTVVVGAVTVNILVSISSSYAVAGANPDAYVEAVPLRLLVTALLLLVGGVTARRWLRPGGAPFGGRGVTAWWNRLRTRTAAGLRVGRDFNQSIRSAHAARPARVANLARCGKAVAVAARRRGVPHARHERCDGANKRSTDTGIHTGSTGVPRCFSFPRCTVRWRFPRTSGASGIDSWPNTRPPRALCGWPATLSGSALTVVAAALFVLALTLLAIALRLNAANTLENFLRYGMQAPEMDFHFIDATRIAVQGTTLAAIGMLAAYSIGQLSSMLVRSEILAAFFALVLSVFLSAWIAMVFAWQLSGWLFVLPLAAGLMLATWLRAPDWIAGRTSWRSWIKPALAVVAAVSLVGVMLPSARLDQIRNRRYRSLCTAAAAADQHCSDLFPPLAAGLAQARETADMYRQAAALMHSSRQNNFKLLDRWFQPEYLEDDGMGTLGGINEAKIPPDQLHQYRETLLSYEKLTRDADAAVVKLLIEASSRPFCYFEFDVRQVAHVSPQRQAAVEFDAH